MNAQTTSAQLVKALTGQFQKIVSENFIELWSLRNGERAVKGAVAFSITPNGERDFTIASSFSFGIRLKHNLKEKCVVIEQ